MQTRSTRTMPTIQMQKIGRTAAALLAIALLSACNNKFEGVPDEELADSMHACRTEQDQSPGMAIRCDNVIRECARRRDDGRYVC